MVAFERRLPTTRPDYLAVDFWAQKIILIMQDTEEIDFDVAAALGAGVSYDQRFAIYIPNKDQNGASVDQKRWVNESLRLLSSICGGATAMPPVRGAWLNDHTDELIVEEPVLVYAFVDPEKFHARFGEIAALVHQIGLETNQGEMAVEFNQTFLRIRAPFRES